MNAISRRAIMAGGVGCASLVLPFKALAASAYPEHPVRMIVPIAPGGPSDVFARLIANKLTESLGQRFYIDNRPGAGGNIGMGDARGRRRTATPRPRGA